MSESVSESVYHNWCMHKAWEVQIELQMIELKLKDPSVNDGERKTLLQKQLFKWREKEIYGTLAGSQPVSYTDEDRRRRMNELACQYFNVFYSKLPSFEEKTKEVKTERCINCKLPIVDVPDSLPS